MGPPAGLVTIALTRTAKRSRTGIHKMSVYRLTVRSLGEERGRRERVRDRGDVGVKATASLVRRARKRLSSDTTERVPLMLHVT